MDPARKALETAARPVLERIEADRSKAPPLIRSVLGYLVEHIFDPDLDVNQLRRACGIRDNSLPIYFREAVGLAPFAYIEDCRLAVASRLLAFSRLKIWQIAQVVGYSTLQVFSRAFTRWSGGKNPSSYRREARKAQFKGLSVDVPRTSSATATQVVPSSEVILSRAMEGSLGREEADELAHLLVKLYPKSFQTAWKLPSPPDTGAIELSELERCYAETRVWERVRDLSFDEARSVVRSYAFSSTALFDLLVAKSLQTGRQDRKRGIELAELALESAEASAAAWGEKIWEQRALGEAWIGNQKRLGLDFSGAETAFGRAFEALTRTQCDGESLTAGLVYALKGSFRSTQTRYEPALELTNRGLEIFRQIGDRREETLQLMQRALIYTYSGRPEKAVADYASALEIALDLKAESLAVMITINQAGVLALMKSYEQAETVLVSLDRDLARELSPQYPSHIEFIEGQIEQGYGRLGTAEAKFLRARSGFDELNESLDSALVSLELSILYSEMGRFSEVIEICLEIVPFFESLTLGEKTLVSLYVLKEALSRENLTTTILRDLRYVLRGDPLFGISK